MRIDILTVLPELLESPFQHSIMQRAREKGLLEVHLHNPRDYTTQKQKQVDDYQFGGGAGMVMTIQPIADCIADGERLTQSIANQLSMYKNIIMVCGHYKGIDERIREHYITHQLVTMYYLVENWRLWC